MAKLNTKIVMLEGEKGKDGTNIKSVEKSASDRLTDTYTMRKPVQGSLNQSKDT